MAGGLFCGKEKQKNHSLSMLDLFQTALCHLEFDDSIELVFFGRGTTACQVNQIRSWSRC